MLMVHARMLIYINNYILHFEKKLILIFVELRLIMRIFYIICVHNFPEVYRLDNIVSCDILLV